MATAKADRLLVEKAQRQRHKAKTEHRRKLYQDSLDDILNEDTEALKAKHGVTDRSSSSSFEYTA